MDDDRVKFNEGGGECSGVGEYTCIGENVLNYLRPIPRSDTIYTRVFELRFPLEGKSWFYVLIFNFLFILYWLVSAIDWLLGSNQDYQLSWLLPNNLFYNLYLYLSFFISKFCTCICIILASVNSKRTISLILCPTFTFWNENLRKKTCDSKSIFFREYLIGQLRQRRSWRFQISIDIGGYFMPVLPITFGTLSEYWKMRFRRQTKR